MDNDKLSNPIAAKLRALGVLRRFGRDELLFAAGDPANGFYIIQSGQVRVFKMDDEGREVEVARLGPGETLAEAAAFAAKEFPLFAQAVRDSTVLFFDKDSVLRRIEADPSLAGLFISLLAKKCLTLNRRIESLGLLTVKQRLAQYLLSQCSGRGQCLVDLTMTKGELAKMLGTVNETLSRTLKQMREEGWIEVKGGRIMIKDCPALRSELR
jgi:CRP/FNR family transcriptional regulator, dissimilatory nitrate respiration regulator